MTSIRKWTEFWDTPSIDWWKMKDGWLSGSWSTRFASDLPQSTTRSSAWGGGTVRYEWNMDAIKESGMVILMTAALEELIRRVKLADRPRVNVGTTVEEDIRLIWQKSRDKYYAAADLVYATDQKSIDEEVRELEGIILKYFNR